jgi:hypothetical protein
MGIKARIALFRKDVYIFYVADLKSDLDLKPITEKPVPAFAYDTLFIGQADGEVETI